MPKQWSPKRLLGVALLASLADVAGAAPVRAFRRLDTVVRDADTIALAIVGPTRPIGDGVAVTLQVVETLKGSLPASLGACYPLERAPNAVADSTGKTVVAFLGPPRDGGERRLFALTDGAPPAQYVVVVPNASPAVTLPERTPDDTALTKVIKEFARSAATSTHAGAWAYLLNLAWSRDVDPSVPVSLREAFLAMNNSSNSWLAKRGVDGLLALGEIEGLRALQDALSQRPDDWRERGWPSALGNYYRSESIEGTAILEGMISPGSPAELRRAAGQALGRIHSFPMLPLLARMLDDADIDLRSKAVRGFSAFAAGFRVTGPQRKEGEWPFLTVEAMTWAVHDDALFRQREAEYLIFWRNWWARNRALVMEMAQREQRQQ